MSRSYAEVIRATDGLVAYWRLGEASGTVIVDEMGAYPGTLTGTPLPTLGVAGLLTGDSNTAIRFADSDNGGGAMNVAVGVSGDLAFAGNAPFAFECWITLTAFRGNSAFLLWNSFVDGGGSQGWYVFVDAGRLGMARQRNGVAVTTFMASPTLNTLYHVVATYDGATQRVSINGALVDSDANADALVTGSTVQPKIGGTGPQVVTGVMDEVAVYNSALSAGHIFDHYQVGSRLYRTGNRKILRSGPRRKLVAA